MLKKVTPIMYVEAIEPSLPFWEALGFERSAEVPEGDVLGFVILARDGLEVMYQTRASAAADVPMVKPPPLGGTIIFIEIEDLDEVARRLEGYEIAVPRRQTFYGADELWFREPAGNLVGFAQMGG